MINNSHQYLTNAHITPKGLKLIQICVHYLALSSIFCLHFFRSRRVTARTAVTARPCGHGRSRPIIAVTAGHGGHGRPRPNGGTEGRAGGGGGHANAALANNTVARPIRVSERANGRIERPAPPGTRPRRRRLGGSRRGRVHGGHGKHCPSRPSLPPKAERSSAGSRPRRHGNHCAQASPGSRPLVALPLPITPSHGSHGASRRARTVTACTAGAVGSVAAGCEGTR